MTENSNMTLLSVLQTCVEIAKTGGRPWSNILKTALTTAEEKELNGIHLQHDRFFLVLSADESINVQDFYDPNVDFGIIVINLSMPEPVAPLLMSVASGVIMHSSVEGLEEQALYCAMLASLRGLPVVESCLNPDPSSLLASQFTMALTKPSHFPMRIRQSMPSARFPFLVMAADKGMGFYLKPEAPIDFLTEAHPESGRFAGVLSRVQFLFTRAFNNDMLMLNKRYVACMLGDLCMSIEDEFGNRVTSLMHVPVPKLEKSKLEKFQ